MLQLAVGLWRVWSSVARFVAADPPSSLRVRALNPSRGAPVVAGGAFLDMCVELFYASPLRAVLTGGGGVDDHHHLGGLDHCWARILKSLAPSWVIWTFVASSC